MPHPMSFVGTGCNRDRRRRIPDRNSDAATRAAPALETVHPDSLAPLSTCPSLRHQPSRLAFPKPLRTCRAPPVVHPRPGNSASAMSAHPFRSTIPGSDRRHRPGPVRKSSQPDPLPATAGSRQFFAPEVQPEWHGSSSSITPRDIIAIAEKSFPAVVKCKVAFNLRFSHLEKTGLFEGTRRSKIFGPDKSVQLRDSAGVKNLLQCGLQEQTTISRAAKLTRDAQVDFGFSVGLLIDSHLADGLSVRNFTDQDHAVLIGKFRLKPGRMLLPADCLPRKCRRAHSWLICPLPQQPAVRFSRPPYPNAAVEHGSAYPGRTSPIHQFSSTAAHSASRLA